jgi:hypothetical protein
MPPIAILSFSKRTGLGIVASGAGMKLGGPSAIRNALDNLGRDATTGHDDDASAGDRRIDAGKGLIKS